MSNKNVVHCKFKERNGYIYCYGSNGAVRMPYRVILFHKTKRTIYGFLSGADAFKFIFERIPHACWISAHSFRGVQSYYIVDERIGNKGHTLVLESSVDLLDVLEDHYRCGHFDYRGL